MDEEIQFVLAESVAGDHTEMVNACTCIVIYVRVSTLIPLKIISA